MAPYIAYEDYNPKPDTLALIQWADRTARDYKSRGFNLTLRQLYYQGVSQNLFPNSERSYKNLGNAVSRGRMAGLVDWSLLEDRGRNPGGTGWFGHQMPTVQGLIERAKWGRTLDLWEDQPNRVEVWVEKQALEEVAESAANKYRIPYIACKGYMSQSEMWEAGYHRLRKYIEGGQHPIILHIGDHDPSGIDMTRDIEERLTTFSQSYADLGYPIEVRRLALNMDQIDEFNPPPNPAKVTDSRFADYEARYGGESWELDALRPELLIELITDEIEELVDHGLYEERERIEDEAIAEMGAIAARWPEIRDYLEANPA